MFRTVRLSFIRSLFTVYSAMVYVIQFCRQLSSREICSCSKAVYRIVWHTPLLSIQWINFWWWTDELSETCSVSCQNKFVKLVHLVGFIINKHLYVILSRAHYVTELQEVVHVESCFINIDIRKNSVKSYLRQKVCRLNFQAKNICAEFLNKSALFHSINLVYSSFDVLAVMRLIILFVWYIMLHQQ